MNMAFNAVFVCVLFALMRTGRQKASALSIGGSGTFYYIQSRMTD